jgi:diguanylate cyclase (GGDEF)-like protein/PAS domain S-box-containing protein
LLDLAAIGMAVTTTDGRFLVVNPKLCSLLDHSAPDLATSSLHDITHPDEWSNLSKALADLARGTIETWSQRQRCLAADGGFVWVDLTVSLAPGRTGLPPQCLAQFIDVTAEVQNLQTLHAAARHFQVLSENSTDIVAQTDPQGLITWVSPSVTSVLGWETGLLAGRSITAFVPKPDLATFGSALARVRQGGEMHGEVVRFRSTTGAYRFMSVTARPLTVDGGLITGLALGLRDVTEELRAKRELARSEEQFRMAMHGAPEGMAVTDAHDRIVQANPALCELLGTDFEHLIGHRFREFMPFEERTQVEDLREQLQVGELETVRLEHRLMSAAGEVWVDHAVGVLRDDGGRPQLFVHQFADRTETRRMQADLTFRATHDIQTGLANRANLLTRLEARLGVAPTEPGFVGVLWIDIDNLKQINDQLGHRIGDDVIAAVADRLKESVRHKDIVGRIGGDEFVIVLDQCPDHDILMSIAENVQRAASRPVKTDIGKVKVTVSVGAVLAASTADTDEALSRADHALYRAKRSGRNQVAGEELMVRDDELDAAVLETWLPAQGTAVPVDEEDAPTDRQGDPSPVTRDDLDPPESSSTGT